MNALPKRTIIHISIRLTGAEINDQRTFMFHRKTTNSVLPSSKMAFRHGTVASQC